jgi:hypothetical protein
VAGFLHLLLAVPAPIRLICIPSRLLVHGDATATAGNVAAQELLFCLGVVSDLLRGALPIPLALLVYRSGFLPRLLGVWLIVNARAYVVTSFTGLAGPCRPRTRARSGSRDRWWAPPPPSRPSWSSPS